MTHRAFRREWAKASLQVERAVDPDYMLRALIAHSDPGPGWVLMRVWMRKPLLRLGSHIVRFPRQRMI